MPYEVLETEIKKLTDEQRKAVFLFVRSLMSQENDGGTEPHQSVGLKGGERKLGGFEKNYYMAPDFDEPISDFAEYS